MTSGDFMKKYDWIVVDGNNMYIVEQWLAEFICDNVNKDELEYITKAFILIKPKDTDEAKEFLQILRQNNVRKIIDAIYERSRR